MEQLLVPESAAADLDQDVIERRDRRSRRFVLDEGDDHDDLMHGDRQLTNDNCRRLRVWRRLEVDDVDNQDSCR